MSVPDFTPALICLIPWLSGFLTFSVIVFLLLPYVKPNSIATRLNTVTKRGRDKIVLKSSLLEQPSSLRKAESGWLKILLERIKWRDLMAGEGVRQKLLQANWRGPNSLAIFIIIRLILPPVFAGLAFLLTFYGKYNFRPSVGLLIIFGAFFVGIYLPRLIIVNAIQRRQMEFQKAFPDALDLLTICVESGLSIEDAFGRVAQEFGISAAVLVEEFELTTAELAYLPDQRQAYENLALRVGLPSVRAVTTALIQAQKYGTPLTSALRIAAQENREGRMAFAEKKAAALPAKLTVPMIVFFLPVIFIVILGPAIIQILIR